MNPDDAHTMPCPDCDGRGYDEFQNDIGDGDDRWRWTDREPCLTCNGTGRIPIKHFHIYRTTRLSEGWTQPELLSSWRTHALAYVHMTAEYQKPTNTQSMYWIQDTSGTSPS